MSTNESTSERECKSIESASGMTAEIENARSIEDLTMNISEEFFEIYKLSFNFLKGNFTDTMIHDISCKMDILYQSIIDAEDANPDEIATLAAAYLLLSNLYTIDNTQAHKHDNITKINLVEPSAITKCIELLKGRELGHKFILTAINAYYNLGDLYKKQNNRELSLDVYNTAFQLYLTYTKEGEICPAPFYIALYFGLTNSDPQDLLDKGSVMVMQALLTEYRNPNTYTEAELIHIEKIAMCQHKILSKKLNNTIALITDYNVWILTAVILSQHFAIRNRFTEARDHLAVASLIAKIFYKNTYTDESDVKKALIYNIYKQTSAELLINWAKYGIQLLWSSQEKMLNNRENFKLCTICKFKSLSIATCEDESNKLLIFANIKNKLQEFTATVTDKYLSSYTEALVIFQFVMNYLIEARAYYSSEIDLESYTWIITLTSQAHKCFAFYVSKTDKLKLYKQRQEIVSTVLEIINFKHNAYVSRMLIEAIIIANDILEMMCENLQSQRNELKKSTKKITEEMAIEINKITKNGIKMCYLYLNCPKLMNFQKL